MTIGKSTVAIGLVSASLAIAPPVSVDAWAQAKPPRAATDREDEVAPRVVVLRQEKGAAKDYILAVVGVVGALVGTLVGHTLASGAATRQRRETRQEQALEALDSAFADARHQSIDLLASGESRAGIDRARAAIDESFAKHGARVEDPVLFSRLRSVVTFLTHGRRIASDDVIDLGLVTGFERGIANARVSLTAALKGQPLPRDAFPGNELLLELLAELDGQSVELPFESLHVWLEEHAPSAQVESLIKGYPA